eukprot:2276558-Rhodomonas_salina.1
MTTQERQKPRKASPRNRRCTRRSRVRVCLWQALASLLQHLRECLVCAWPVKETPRLASAPGPGQSWLRRAQG